MRGAVKRQVNSLRSDLESNLQAGVIHLMNHNINPKTTTRRTYLLLAPPFPLRTHPRNVVDPLLVILHKRGKFVLVLFHKINNVLSDLPVILWTSP